MRLSSPLQTGPWSVTQLVNITGGCPFTGISLLFQNRLASFAAKNVPSSAGIEFLDVQILDVELQVGDAPGDAVVVPDDDSGQTGERRAPGLQLRTLEIHHVPGGRDAERQMGVVGQQRFARSGELAGDHPRIRAGRNLAARAQRPELLDKVAIDRRRAWLLFPGRPASWWSGRGTCGGRASIESTTLQGSGS